MTPADYDAWYDTPRGRWVGDTEFGLVRRQLGPRPGETLLDVGCGSGWFTRRFAAEIAPENGWNVTGLDVDPAMLDFARAHGRDERYLAGDARALPFADASFDRVIAIASLCFVADERQALAEIVRVARRGFAVGWLNRHSLWHRRHAGRPAYRGAAWHTAREARALFAGLPVAGLRLTSAVFLPGGGSFARLVERLMPARAPLGALLLATGEPAR
jgi:SAM-dependent methyltransferase